MLRWFVLSPGAPEAPGARAKQNLKTNIWCRALLSGLSIGLPSYFSLIFEQEPCVTVPGSTSSRNRPKTGPKPSVAMLSQAILGHAPCQVGQTTGTSAWKAVVQTMAACALWQLTATWMSGETVQFHIDSNSTAGELRRRIMLVSGGMQKVALLVEKTALEGNDKPLSHFKAQGLDNGAELTIVVSQMMDASAAKMLTNAELTAFLTIA